MMKEPLMEPVTVLMTRLSEQQWSVKGCPADGTTMEGRCSNHQQSRCSGSSYPFRHPTLEVRGA